MCRETGSPNIKLSKPWTEKKENAAINKNETAALIQEKNSLEDRLYRLYRVGSPSRDKKSSMRRENTKGLGGSMYNFVGCY